MSHVDGGGPQPAGQLRDLGAGLHAQLGVQVGQRLVHEEHLRVPDDRAAHGHALPLAAGEGLGLAVQELLEVEEPGRLLHTSAALVRGDARDLQGEAHVVRHGHVRVEGVVLEHHRDVPVLGLHVGDVPVAQEHPPPGEGLEASEHAQGGGLAAARGTHEHEELAVGDLQVQPVHGGAGGVGVLTSGGLERHGGHGGGPFTGRHVPDDPGWKGVWGTTTGPPSGPAA